MTTYKNKENTKEKLVRIALRLPPAVRDQVYAVAASEGMPGAVWVRALIIRELDLQARREDHGRGGRNDV